jgi:hypothetical protein
MHMIEISSNLTASLNRKVFSSRNDIEFKAIKKCDGWLVV